MVVQQSTPSMTWMVDACPIQWIGLWLSKLAFIANEKEDKEVGQVAEEARAALAFVMKIFVTTVIGLGIGKYIQTHTSESA